MVAVEESLDLGKARVERLEREFAIKVTKRQQLLSKRQETSQTASCPLADGEDSFQDLQVNVAGITAERNEWCAVATKATEKLKAAQANVALQSTLC